MDIYRLFMDTCMTLWAGDCKVSYELFVKHVNYIIDNLKSQIGPDHHKRLEELGVIDNTGESWGDQDAYIIKQLKTYEELLKFLEDDHNWTP